MSVGRLSKASIVRKMANIYLIVFLVCSVIGSETRAIHKGGQARLYNAPYRNKRQTATEENISPITKIFVDGLDYDSVNSLKPSLGTQAVYLEAIKPLLVSLGTGFIKEILKFVKGILDQGPFIDAKSFTESKYEAFPVLIPNHGSFILLSKAGTMELMKQKGNDVPDCRSNCTILEKSANVSLSPNTEETNGTKAASRSDPLPPEIVDKNKSYYIGEAHLIPINSNSENLESARELEDVYKENDNGPVREYMKQISDAGFNIKSFKKRLLLSLLKKMENAIRNL